MQLNDPVSTLNAMRRQEIEYSVSDQLSKLLKTQKNPPFYYVYGRITMTKWCFEIANMFEFNRETVEIALSLFDRFDYICRHAIAVICLLSTTTLPLLGPRVVKNQLPYTNHHLRLRDYLATCLKSNFGRLSQFCSKAIFLPLLG